MLYTMILRKNHSSTGTSAPFTKGKQIGNLVAKGAVGSNFGGIKATEKAMMSIQVF